MPMEYTMIRLNRSVPSLLLAAALFAGCSANPVTGKNELALVSEQEEIQMGRQAHQQILAQNPPYRDANLQAYVNRVGQLMAAQNHRPGVRYTFTVLDDPEVNAFALPGGYIYITSGLMAYLNSEADLAAVLGHEIGHVASRHNVSQASWSAIGGLLASMAGEKLGNKELFNAIGELGLSRYSRQQELEADALGAEYLARAGYDPIHMANVIAILQAYDQFRGGGGGAYRDLFSTHPSNDVRLQQLIQQARRYGGGTRDSGVVTYLSQINGLRLPLSNGQIAQLRVFNARPGESFDGIAQGSVLGGRGAMQLRVLNGLFPDGEPRPGQLVKTVL